MKAKDLISEARNEELLTTEELGDFFRLSPQSARKLCIKHGVMPLNVGVGKIARLRWRRSEVIQMLGTLETKPQPASSEYIPRKRGSKTVLGKTVNQLMRELAESIQ